MHFSYFCVSAKHGSGGSILMADSDSVVKIHGDKWFSSSDSDFYIFVYGCVVNDPKYSISSAIIDDPIFSICNNE